VPGLQASDTLLEQTSSLCCARIRGLEAHVPLASAPSCPLDSAFPHRFSTKYHAHETRLNYYGYRFYSPELMRWFNRNPIEKNSRELKY